MRAKPIKKHAALTNVQQAKSEVFEITLGHVGQQLNTCCN
jgi:hypothetical protein